MQQTPCDECGKPITDKVRLEAGISFCSKACEHEDSKRVEEQTKAYWEQQRENDEAMLKRFEREQKIRKEKGRQPWESWMF